MAVSLAVVSTQHREGHSSARLPSRQRPSLEGCQATTQSHLCVCVFNVGGQHVGPFFLSLLIQMGINRILKIVINTITFNYPDYRGQKIVLKLSELNSIKSSDSSTKLHVF